MKAKTKRCKQCKTKHTANEQGRFDMFSPPNSLGFFCDTDCAADWTRDNPVKLKQMYKREYNRETVSMKKEFAKTDVKGQKKLTQTAFNKMRKLQEFMWFKLRGLEPECISCGKKNMDWCCGHYKTIGSSAHLRYDEKNTYLQCNGYCNVANSGNIEGNSATRGYKKGLIERFGEDKAQEIFDYCDKHEVKKWEVSELIELRIGFLSEIRKLEIALQR